MLAELLELSRAAAGNDGWSRDALLMVLRGMNRLTSAAGLRGGLSAYDVLSGEGAVPAMTLSERIEAGERALVESRRPQIGADCRDDDTGGVPEGESDCCGARGGIAGRQAARAGRIRSIREDMEREKEAEKAKDNGEESK